MEQLVNFIIRPPRAEYDPKNDLLDQEFMLKGKWHHRKDVEVVNSRGDVLQCSHYMPIVCPEEKPLPCVIYCHGNSGCRADASEAAIILLPSNITVFTLDFSGSGLSGGEHVTLGFNEKDDLRAVVDHLRADGNVSLIGLWGRSMGAVTSLLYGAEDPSIAGMVLDSPFSDLVDLMMELVDTYKIRLPKFTVKFAIQYMRRAIQKKAKFDIVDLNTIKIAKSCFVPALFGHATDDDFILPHHSDRIFDAYEGDKNIIKFEGDHNSPRPQFYFDSISIFFNNVLQPPADEVGDTFFDLSHDYIGKGRWNTVHEMRFSDDLLTAPSDPTAANSTENAIEQLRSRRPMSRIEVPSDISSKDKQTESQDEDTATDSVASSSNMISFELSNGNPCGLHVPASIDDDDYVEYALDDLGDFPSNMEEEERMLMEAIIESLKDLEVKKPHVEDPSSKVGGEPLEPAAKDGGEPLEPAAKDDHKDSSAKTECSPSNMDSAKTTTATKNCSATEPSFPDIRKSSVGPAHAVTFLDTEPSFTDISKSSVGPARALTFPNEAKKSGTSSQSDTSANQSSSVPETIDQTTATITVEKNPANNIMDGLLRRWDLNFFRGR